MRYLKTNTATVIGIGPFLDATDGITPETAITVTGCHLTLIVDNAGTPTLALDADATASGGNNDMVHITNDDAGMYSLELTAAQTNYLGGGVLSIVNTAVHCPVFHEFVILPAVVFDSLVAGSDLFDVSVTQIAGSAVSTTTAQLGVNAVQISGDGTAADNLETAFDETAGAVPWIGIIDQGTAQSATSTTVVLRSASAFGNDTLKGMVIAAFGSDQAYWQTRLITGSVLATDTVTVDAWGVTPTGTITYKIWGAAPGSTASPVPSDVRSWLGTTVATPGTAGVPSVDTVRIATAAVSTSTAQIGVNAVQVGGQTASAAGTVTFPGTVASSTNITGGTITTVTNLTNAPTAGDLTATMKASIFTTALTEAYAADGAAGTLSQILFAIQSFLQEKQVSGTTVTCKRLDGTTTSMTFTLNDGTTPTTITRAT